MNAVPNAADRIVATIDGPRGMPAAERIAGFTMMMYAIVRNVVIPATVSCRYPVPWRSNPKNIFTARSPAGGDPGSFDPYDITGWFLATAYGAKGKVHRAEWRRAGARSRA